MIKIVELNGVKKELDTESLVADYIAAGWKVVKEEPKNILTNKGNIK